MLGHLEDIAKRNVVNQAIGNKLLVPLLENVERIGRLGKENVFQRKKSDCIHI
jgi:hypothetical protein